MRRDVVFIACLVIPLLFGCRTDPSSNTTFQLIYRNSFESPADTNGWNGFGSLWFYPGAAHGGGVQSAYISGGCFFPHARGRVKIRTASTTLSLQCWGKNLAVGGFMQLYRVKDPNTSISVQITDTVWTFYRSSTYLSCFENDTLELTLNSGGAVYSAMLVDNIEIGSVQ